MKKLGFDPNGPIAQGIRAEYATCYDTAELAARLGTSRDTLQVYASKLGIKRTTSRPYKLHPGTTADRAVTYLRSLPPGAEVSSSELCQACGLAQKRIVHVLEPAARAGVLAYRLDPTDFRSTALWRLGDGKPTEIRQRRSDVKREPKPPKPKKVGRPGKDLVAKPRTVPTGAVWQADARLSWANAAGRRINANKVANAPVVIPSHVKVQKLPGFTEDTRFKADPNAYGCGFSAVGIGRDVETGRAW